MATILSFSFPIGDSLANLRDEPVNPEVTTLDEASGTLPPGAYTTFRTYPNLKVLFLNDHFRRLEESSALAGHPIHLDIPPIRKHLRSVLLHFPEPQARVRLTIPFDPSPDRLFIFVSALSVPTQAQKDHGVAVITAPFQRTLPSAKLSAFIQSSQPLRSRLKEGYEEVLMVDDRLNILEGLTSNFYAVTDGVLLTAAEGVLSGITRQTVLQLARAAGIKISLESPKLNELRHFDEAFITSTSRGVLPVTEIDHQSVGIGIPGLVTKHLMDLYDRKVAAEIEPI